jgi:hypothetical protein
MRTVIAMVVAATISSAAAADTIGDARQAAMERNRQCSDLYDRYAAPDRFYDPACR